MSFQGQNPAKQCDDTLVYDAHTRFKIKNCVILYNITSERVKIRSLIAHIP